MQTLKNIIYNVSGFLLVLIGRIIGFLILRITVSGVENVPAGKPLIVTANHFSWFDAPLLTLHLPVRPAFLIATESQRFWFVRMFMSAFNGIPIWRGRVDREAIRRAMSVLQQGEAIGIFPEGGIDPRLRANREQGQQIIEQESYAHIARYDGQLTHPLPGTAYLAVESQALILPVALLGTEHILNNMLRLRRTDVTIHIGQSFGPLTIEQNLSRIERKQNLNRLAEQIMVRIAALFPQNRRGPYRDMNLEMM